MEVMPRRGLEGVVFNKRRKLMDFNTLIARIRRAEVVSGKLIHG